MFSAETYVGHADRHGLCHQALSAGLILLADRVSLDGNLLCIAAPAVGHRLVDLSPETRCTSYVYLRVFGEPQRVLVVSAPQTHIVRRRYQVNQVVIFKDTQVDIVEAPGHIPTGRTASQDSFCSFQLCTRPGQTEGQKAQ